MGVAKNGAPVCLAWSQLLAIRILRCRLLYCGQSCRTQYLMAGNGISDLRVSWYQCLIFDSVLIYRFKIDLSSRQSVSPGFSWTTACHSQNAQFCCFRTVFGPFQSIFAPKSGMLGTFLECPEVRKSKSVKKWTLVHTHITACITPAHLLALGHNLSCIVGVQYQTGADCGRNYLTYRGVEWDRTWCWGPGVTMMWSPLNCTGHQGLVFNWRVIGKS